MDAEALNMSRLSTWEFQRDFYPLPPRERSKREITKIVARHSPAVFTFKRLARRHPITGKARCLVMVNKLATVRQLPAALLAFNYALNVDIRPGDIRAVGCVAEGRLMGCHCWPRHRGWIKLKGFQEAMSQRQVFRVRPSFKKDSLNNMLEDSLTMVAADGLRFTMKGNGWYRIEYNCKPHDMFQGAFRWLIDEVNDHLKLSYPEFE